MARTTPARLPGLRAHTNHESLNIVRSQNNVEKTAKPLGEPVGIRELSFVQPSKNARSTKNQSIDKPWIEPWVDPVRKRLRRWEMEWGMHPRERNLLAENSAVIIQKMKNLATITRNRGQSR
jgi:hypothetical protein